MESNDIITVREVLKAYENLNLSSELRLDKNKYQNGLIKVFANFGEKINFKSSDYESNWDKLKKQYSRLIKKLSDNKCNKKLDPYRNFDLNDIFYSKALYPTLCYKKSR